jgi:oligopeptide/dipeptide ABC transporter ATP-binding protein
MNPDLLIADEPTTALDVIVEAQFLDLLNDLKNRFNLTIILITHNLGNVAQLADRITVMYGGTIAEVAHAQALFDEPMHPYTQGLLASIPNIKLDQPRLITMPGSPPDLVDPPSGCIFHPRCPYVMDICIKDRPEIFPRDGHQVSCWLYR